MTENLIGTDQKIPDGPIKITFLEKLRLQLDQGVSLGLLLRAFV